jgi:hypothetical protein
LAEKEKQLRGGSQHTGSMRMNESRKNHKYFSDKPVRLVSGKKTIETALNLTATHHRLKDNATHKEDLKPTEKDIIEANNRVAIENFERWRQALREYILLGGKITFTWDKKEEVLG